MGGDRMKFNTKRFILPTIIIIIAMLATGCGKNSGNKGKDPDDYVKITENLYVHWINDIYTNIDEYEGKTIEIDGMFEPTKKAAESLSQTDPITLLAVEGEEEAAVRVGDRPLVCLLLLSYASNFTY